MNTLRIATYNIHKGVRGMGLQRRLEIHNLAHAVEQFDADIVCLQEVRRHHKQLSGYFKHWPDQPQAQYLAPEGYEAVYRTNAFTTHGEHGNAVLSRWPVVTHQHEDMSDHALEQRGLLHVEVNFQTDSQARPLHIVVLHLGLIPASRVRQVRQLGLFIEREIPHDSPLVVAGDFNDWGQRLRLMMHGFGLKSWQPSQHLTFPAQLPLVQLDYVYARGMQPTSVHIPQGRVWRRMSDHLPLIAEFALPHVNQPA